MRVGVTGGTGFIGQYLLRDYSEKYDFIAPVRSRRGMIENSRSVTYVESDFSTTELRKVFQDCDAVIHLAAKGMPKNREPLKMTDYEQNVICASHVFEACKDAGVRRVICASTKSVYGNRESAEHMILQETDDVDPTDEYGVSKCCVEVMADFYRRMYGMELLIYRMPEVCGMDLTRGMLNPFWAAVLNAVLHQKEIPIYGRGRAGRDLVYVKDVTRALDLGLRSEKTGSFHIGMGQIMTNRQIAEMFSRVFEHTAGIHFYTDKPEWGTIQYLGVRKAADELGYTTAYDLLKLVEDIKAEHDGYSRE